MTKKRLLSFVLVMILVMLVVPLQTYAEDDFPSVLAEAKKGVAQIYGLGDDGYTLSGWVGTGFAVGEEGEESDIFLTNWHVVTGNGEYDLSDVRLWILQENCYIDNITGEPDPKDSVECEVLKTTSGYPDYAIIQATESISGYLSMPLMASSDDVPDGTTVYALGYPAVVGDASVTHYGIDDITATNGMVSQHMQYAYEGNTWVLMHTAQISGGNSGGPLITEKGVVVGLNTYGFGEHYENMNRYCAVYIDYAIDGLEELGLPYHLSDGTKKDEMSDVLIYAILSAVVVVGVVAALLIIVKKKKQAEEEARRRQEAQRRQEEERRRQEEIRRQEEQRRQEEKRRQQAVKAKLQLNGGAVYAVPASGSVIGREKDCSIVLPEKTAGVSRYHCKLEFREGQLLLTDLNSTYGTYIHGKRVPANIPITIKSGTSFCLGSDQVIFTVL